MNLIGVQIESHFTQLLWYRGPKCRRKSREFYC